MKWSVVILFDSATNHWFSRRLTLDWRKEPSSMVMSTGSSSMRRVSPMDHSLVEMSPTQLDHRRPCSFVQLRNWTRVCSNPSNMASPTSISPSQPPSSLSFECPYFEATINETFLVQLFEDKPNWFHEPRIHRLVIILEINPSAHSIDHILSSETHPIISLVLIPSDRRLTSHSVAYRMTILRQWSLYAAIPIAATSSGPLMPNVLSISYSTGKPWQSRRERAVL